MVQLVEKPFTHTSSTRLPVATFAAWQKLCDAFATCGQLSKRQPLLLNPITFALKSDRRPAVHQVSCPVTHTPLLTVTDYSRANRNNALQDLNQA